MGPAGDRSPLHRDLRSKSQRAPGLEADSGLPWCGEPGREGVAGGLQEEAFRRQRTASGQLEPGEGVRCHSVHVMSSYLWPREHPARGRQGPERPRLSLRLKSASTSPSGGSPPGSPLGGPSCLLC